MALVSKDNASHSSFHFNSPPSIFITMEKSKAVLSQIKSIPLSEEDATKLKQVLVMMLVDFREACKKEDIPWCIQFGTLLGAVRHKGFIPWDDDIDLQMPFEYFDQVQGAMDKYFPGKYTVTGLGHGDQDDPVFCLKLGLNGTVATQFDTSGWPFKRRISIDIMPITSMPNTHKKRIKQGNKITRLVHLRTFNYEWRYPPKGVLKDKGPIGKYYRKRSFIAFFAHLLPKKWLTKKLIKEFERKFKDSDYVGDNLTYGSRHERGVTWKDYLPYKEYEFEGEFFPGPANADACLRQCYGNDYMTPPPEDKREVHSYIELDFGKYLH